MSYPETQGIRTPKEEEVLRACYQYHPGPWQAINVEYNLLFRPPRKKRYSIYFLRDNNLPHYKCTVYKVTPRIDEVVNIAAHEGEKKSETYHVI